MRRLIFVMLMPMLMLMLMTTAGCSRKGMQLAGAALAITGAVLETAATIDRGRRWHRHRCCRSSYYYQADCDCW